jgi:hypothetical protein
MVLGTAKAQMGGIKPNAMMAEPKMAGRDSVTWPLTVAARFMKISGALEPKASNVAPAMSSGICCTSQIVSIAGHRYSSQMMAIARKVKKEETRTIA